MKHIVLLLLALISCLHAALPAWEKDYAQLLGKYVSPAGVRYADWKASSQDLETLDLVIEKIAGTDLSYLSRNAQLAFYINAYNAWTLKKVLDLYPIRSVRDVAPDFGFFSEKNIMVVGKTYSLDDVEKGILLAQFQEPRIHAAVNCASRSCPSLSKEPFTERRLYEQLNTAFAHFVNDNPLGVSVAPNGKSVALSSLFQWYAADFKPKGGAVAFINSFRKKPLPADAKITYQPYDWALNEAK